MGQVGQDCLILSEISGGLLGIRWVRPVQWVLFQIWVPLLYKQITI